MPLRRKDLPVDPDQLAALTLELAAEIERLRVALRSINTLHFGASSERLVTLIAIALGRRNSLFAGSERGARNWACLASLLNTCKLNDIDPLTWLTDVPERIVSGRTKNHQLHELLPWIWKAARATPALEAAA